jgi:hypothetical protein
MNALRSNDLSSAHPKKKSRSGSHSEPSEMAQKASKSCQPLPFLWNSYLKLCCGLAGQPSCHSKTAESEPSSAQDPLLSRKDSTGDAIHNSLLSNEAAHRRATYRDETLPSVLTEHPTSDSREAPAPFNDCVSSMSRPPSHWNRLDS